MLPPFDQEYLEERYPAASVQSEKGMLCVIVPGLVLPAGFTVQESDLLLRLAQGYPDVAPDMWWFSPALVRRDGAAIAQTQVTETHLGRQWQRWSRHFQPGQWRPGIDCLESYLALIGGELQLAAKGLAA